jgi:hypothetical protein
MAVAEYAVGIPPDACGNGRGAADSGKIDPWRKGSHDFDE